MPPALPEQLMLRFKQKATAVTQKKGVRKPWCNLLPHLPQQLPPCTAGEQSLGCSSCCIQLQGMEMQQDGGKLTWGTAAFREKTMPLGSPSSTRRWRGANPLPVSRNSSVPALAPPPLLLPLVQRSPSSTAPQDEAARPSICSLGGPIKASQMSLYLLVL